MPNGFTISPFYRQEKLRYRAAMECAWGHMVSICKVRIWIPNPGTFCLCSISIWLLHLPAMPKTGLCNYFFQGNSRTPRALTVLLSIKKIKNAWLKITSTEPRLICAETCWKRAAGEWPGHQDLMGGRGRWIQACQGQASAHLCIASWLGRVDTSTHRNSGFESWFQ